MISLALALIHLQFIYSFNINQLKQYEHGKSTWLNAIKVEQRLPVNCKCKFNGPHWLLEIDS